MNPILLARNAATKLTPAEIATTIDPLRHAARLTREGVAAEHDWVLLASAVNVAKTIERQGVVRGLAEHLHQAELALNAISRRALASGEWKSTALYWQEIDNINALIELHEYQLQQLSYGEARRATLSAAHQVRSIGGCVINADEPSQGALA